MNRCLFCDFAPLRETSFFKLTHYAQKQKYCCHVDRAGIMWFTSSGLVRLELDSSPGLFAVFGEMRRSVDDPVAGSFPGTRLSLRPSITACLPLLSQLSFPTGAVRVAALHKEHQPVKKTSSTQWSKKLQASVCRLSLRSKIHCCGCCRALAQY